MICPECEGKGWRPNKIYGYAESCRLCRAKKDINWLERIFGVNDNGIVMWSRNGVDKHQVKRIYPLKEENK